MKSVLLCVLSVFSFYLLSAQTFGGSPSSIRWRQINTDTVRIIFPEGYEAKARRIAMIVHTLQKNFAHTIGDTIRKVNIVIQDQTLVSNGYVGLAPYRSEFYITPPQNVFELGAVNWTDNLAVHEFRHVQQYSNFNKGLSKTASYILGEQGRALANAAAIPDWFFEGDAVFNETKLTSQGRGALPFFLSSYQSLYNAGRQYSYMKMRNGSLRQYVPDHYNLGYLLVTYGRIEYDDDIWRKITGDAASFKPLFYPFQGAVKKYTGISFDQFVTNAMQYYQKQWQPFRNEIINWLTPVENNNVVNYKYPCLAADGSIIVLKNSYQKIPAFYKIYPDKREEKIAVRDIAVDDYFSYNNGRIIYTAFQSDARWGNRDFNSIKVLDIQTGKETRIINHSKYFAPDISHDGIRIIAVEIKPLTPSRLVMMDVTGKLLDSFSKGDIIFSNPKFAKDNRFYYVAERNDKGEMAIIKYGTGDSRFEKRILPFSNRIIGFLNVQGDTLLFTTTYKGRDEIWAFIDGDAGKGPYRLASYSTGIYQAVMTGDGKLAGSVFTADGYRLASFQPEWQQAAIDDQLTDLYVGGVYKAADHLLLNDLPDREFAVNKYPKSYHLFNIHSFRPYYEQPDYSFTLYGQNILNTLQTQISYNYNQNEGSSKIGYDGVFGGSYLQPLFGISQTWQRSGELILNNQYTTIHWNELTGYGGLQLPLNLSGDKQYRYLTLYSTYNIDHVSWTGLGESLFLNERFNYINMGVSYTGQVQQAVQQIYPHWAQTFSLQYERILNTYTAHQWLATGSLYLPGLSNNHSLVLTVALQGRDTLQQYLFTNNFPFARGYSGVNFPRMWRLGINYHIPVAYPDCGFGNLIYFLRIRANLFFDAAVGKSLRTGIEYPFNTIGTEIYFDTRWWNQQAVSFGIRYSRLLNNEFLGATQPNIWEVILPVNLFN